MVSYDVFGQRGCVILRAQTLFTQGAVKGPLLSVGKLTKSGAEVKLGSKGSWIDLHTDTGMQRVPMRVKSNTFVLTIQKTDAWIIAETSDPAPHAVALVDEEIGRGRAPNPPPTAPDAAAPRPAETKGMQLEKKARDLQQPGRARYSWELCEGGLSSGSKIEDMRNQLKTLGALLWCTKAQLWPRLVHAEARRELQKRHEARLADRACELPKARKQSELRDEPSADERARYECETAFATFSGKCECPRV